MVGPVRRRNHRLIVPFLLASAVFVAAGAAQADDKPVVGLIPKAQNPIQLDGKLDDWAGAFVTPVHAGHPDFANRGGEFLYLWDEQNLYIGLRCLDRKTVNMGKGDHVYAGDAVEFYLDTRRGNKLGARPYGPGTLHMFWSPFTDTEVKPRASVPVWERAFKDTKLQGVEVAGAKTPWGYTAEFKLPWAGTFPNFTPKAGDILGIECELCSSDGSGRDERTFVYSSPAAVDSPSAFGRVQLVDRIDPAELKSFGRVLLPASLTKAANYPWLYGTVLVSPTIAGSIAKLEGKVVDAAGKVRKTTPGKRTTLNGSGFVVWTGPWELFDVPEGSYTVELTALDKANQIITRRSIPFRHSKGAAGSEAGTAAPR